MQNEVDELLHEGDEEELLVALEPEEEAEGEDVAASLDEILRERVEGEEAAE